MIRYNFDKNGNKIPDAKCSKCGADAFRQSYCTSFISFIECSSCTWTWIEEDEEGGFYPDKECKVEPRIPIHELEHDWSHMPFTKEQYKVWALEDEKDFQNQIKKYAKKENRTYNSE